MSKPDTRCQSAYKTAHETTTLLSNTLEDANRTRQASSKEYKKKAGKPCSKKTST